MKKITVLLVLGIALTNSLQAQIGKVGINTTTPAAMLHVKDSSVVFTGTSPLPMTSGSPPVSGPGARLMWYANKAAFRAGRINGMEWDKDSIGFHSVAFGINSKAKGSSGFASGSFSSASGSSSTAMGSQSLASGATSVAMGNQSLASGESAVAIGDNATATGLNSISLGSDILASGHNSTAIGIDNIASGTRSLALGTNTKSLGVGAFSAGGVTKASGNYSTSFGNNTIAKSFVSLVVGYYNDTTSSSSTTWVISDPLFIVGNGTSNNARNNALTVLKTGNIGINTISPNARLHVVRDAPSNGPYTSTAAAIFEGETGSIIQLSNANNIYSGIHSGNEVTSQRSGIIFTSDSSVQITAGGNNPRVYIRHDGNVGIGTLSPQRLLHLNAGTGGTLYHGNAEMIIEDNDATYLQFSSLTAEESGILSGNAVSSIRSAIIFRPDSSLQIRTGGNSTRLTVLKNGNIGIGSTAPTEKLHVVGNICYTGTSAACSDIRYKKNILPINDALSSLQHINGIYYNWDTVKFPDNAFGDERQIGFSAQELELIYPEMVHTNNDGYKSVDYSRMTPILVEAIKEQQEIISSQQSRLAALENELHELKLLVQQLTSSSGHHEK